jgi:methionine-rich copper-binding protein CopC
VAAAVLAAGACLGTVTAAVAVEVGVATVPRADAPVRLLRSDPPDGSWEASAPGQVRLWFSGGAGRTPTARVSTPRSPGMKAAKASYAAGVLTVQVPDGGPGEYRVLWFLVAADGTSSSAAGTLSYRVGAGAGTGPSAAFTIPASATGAAADVLADTATATTSPIATAAPSAPRTSSAASAPPASAPSASVAGAAPSGPGWRRGVRLGTPAPTDLAVTAAAGLLALGLGAGWSLRRGARLAARPR